MDKLHEDSQKQFEEWFMRKYNVTADVMKIMYFKVEIAWESWQASRESIVVEIPDISDIQCQECADDALLRCEKRLRSIGLSIKGEVV